MDIQDLRNLWDKEIEQRLLDIEMWTAINALGIKPKYKQGEWWFSYDDGHGYCVEGHGNNLYKAARNFYEHVYIHKPMK